jgi:hypothetical protein
MPAKSPEFGVAIPQVFLDGKADMELVRSTLRRAEELGYQSAWVQDQVASDVPLLESISLLCYSAAVTSTLKLGVSVVVFPIRNAPQLAKDIGTLDHMSNGRAILGIGLGPVFAGDNYFQIFGTKADEALRRFNEGLAIMKSLWTQKKTDYKGEYRNRCRGRIHQFGSEDRILKCCTGLCAMLTVIWVPDRRRPKTSAKTSNIFASSSNKRAGIRPASRSQNGYIWQ